MATRAWPSLPKGFPRLHWLDFYILSRSRGSILFCPSPSAPIGSSISRTPRAPSRLRASVTQRRRVTSSCQRQAAALRVALVRMATLYFLRPLFLSSFSFHLYLSLSVFCSSRLFVCNHKTTFMSNRVVALFLRRFVTTSLMLRVWPWSIRLTCWETPFSCDCNWFPIKWFFFFFFEINFRLGTKTLTIIIEITSGSEFSFFSWKQKIRIKINNAENETE